MNWGVTDTSSMSSLERPREVHDATDEAGPLPKPRRPLLLVLWGPNAAQAQVATQLMAHRGELRPPVEAFAQEAGTAFKVVPEAVSDLERG